MRTAKPLRIAFMGTPSYAIGPLKAVYDSGHEIVCVYTRPPKPRGRGHKIHPSPVEEWSHAHGLKVRHPKSLKDPDIQAEFMALNLDVAIVVAYGLFLPKAILDAPRHGCINLHPSLLPRWRGAAPIQRALLAGDKVTGMTVMQLDEGMDSGPIIAQQEITIDDDATAVDLHEKLFALGQTMLVEELDKLARTGTLQTTPQDESRVTLADKLEKEEGLVNLQQPAKNIDLKLRSLAPWPGIWLEVGGKRLKIISAKPVPTTEHAAPGTILTSDLTVACGQNSALRLEKVQPEGKSAMDGKAYLNGARLKPGDKLL